MSVSVRNALVQYIRMTAERNEKVLSNENNKHVCLFETLFSHLPSLDLDTLLRVVFNVYVVLQFLIF